MAEILTNEEELKLRIQKEIINRHQEVIHTNDIGWTSWDIACKVVEDLDKLKDVKRIKSPKEKLLDIFKIEL